MTTTRRFHGRRLAVWALAGAAVAAVGVPPAAADPVPLGPETSLDSPLASDFSCPLLAGHDDGSFAVAWNRAIETDTEVVVRTADAGGVLDPAQVVARRRRFQIERLRLAPDPAGYTVLWKEGDSIVDGTRRAFFASERDADGASLGGPLDLGRPTLDISPRPGGGFVAVWNGRRAINVQLLDAQGRETGPPVRIASSRIFFPGVVHSADGQFAVSWIQRIGLVDVLVARRFDAFGHSQGRNVQLVPRSEEFRFLSGYRLGLGDDGTLAVAYRLQPGNPSLDVSELLLLRTFDASGRPLQPPIILGEDAPGSTFALVPDSVSVDPAGNTLVLWTEASGLNDPFSSSSLAIVLPRGALAVESFEFASLASADFHDVTCAIGTLAGDTWVIAWEAVGPSAGTFLGRRLFVRRFGR